MYKLGYKPSSGNLGVPEFRTSGTLVKLAASDSSSTYIIPEYTPISDQLSLNSCAANATADAFEILKGLEDKNSVVQLSRLFVYWNARTYTHDTDKDDGTFIHNALDSLTRLGICEEDLWPYDVSHVYNQPPVLAYKQGNDNTINNFYQITSIGNARLQDIELAVRANHPVIFGTQVDADFQSYTGGDVVFDAPTKFIGGHAMLVMGVRTNISGNKEFYLRNSWNSGWGIDGHAWVSSNYMTWPYTSDLFVPTRMDNLLI